MNFLKIVSFLMIMTVLIACNDDDNLTGSAKLVFTGDDLRDLEIDIYPEAVFTVPDLIRTQPLMKDLLPDANGEVLISNMNEGNYTWYDGGNNIGFFQISAGQTKTYEIFIR